jgi:hypothetical protein
MPVLCRIPTALTQIQENISSDIYLSKKAQTTRGRLCLSKRFIIQGAQKRCQPGGGESVSGKNYLLFIGVVIMLQTFPVIPAYYYWSSCC